MLAVEGSPFQSKLGPHFDKIRSPSHVALSPDFGCAVDVGSQGSPFGPHFTQNWVPITCGFSGFKS